MKKKGKSQRGLGSFVPAHLNDSPFYIDSISNPNENVKEKFSDKVDDGYAKAQKMQTEINNFVLA